tara:strand:+ start:19575 stop:20723 length:1149 start_codon:yes stop_codon:yes gene_type:complete
MSKARQPVSLSDLCEDVILIICDRLDSIRTENSVSLKNLSLTNHYFRHLLIPRLFKTLSINQPISRLAPTSLLHHAQAFKIDMFGSMWWWCSGSYTSSSDALNLFRCIQTLPRLKTLEISMMRRSLDMFTAAFEDSELEIEEFILGKVENLIASSSAAFLASHCPQLKSLVIEDGLDCLVETYTELSERLAPLHPAINARIESHSLVHFDAMAMWSTDEIAALARSLPGLQCLRMRTHKYCYRAPTPIIIEILSKMLKGLQTLHLVKIDNLGMGYQPVWKFPIQVGWNEEYRRALWLDYERLRVDVENYVARLAFADIVTLGELWLGDHRVARRLRKNDGDELRWLWERKRGHVEACNFGSEMFVKFKIEKEAVVVSSEEGM